MLGHHKAKDAATWKTEERVQGQHDETKGCWQARFLAVSRGSLVPRSEETNRFCTCSLEDKTGSSTSLWTVKHPACQERQLT